jgi:hypothetical protein
MDHPGLPHNVRSFRHSGLQRRIFWVLSIPAASFLFTVPVRRPETLFMLIFVAKLLGNHVEATQGGHRVVGSEVTVTSSRRPATQVMLSCQLRLPPPLVGDAAEVLIDHEV